jgi:hypothetical protein
LIYSTFFLENNAGGPSVSPCTRLHEISNHRFENLTESLRARVKVTIDVLDDFAEVNKTLSDNDFNRGLSDIITQFANDIEGIFTDFTNRLVELAISLGAPEDCFPDHGFKGLEDDMFDIVSHHGQVLIEERLNPE